MTPRNSSVTVDLSGKTVLVTGANSGLGAETARIFHRAGARVIINYFPGIPSIREEAEALVTELGEGALALPADVRNYPQVEDLIAKGHAHFGKLDIVVNNAGILRDRTLSKMTLSEWNDVIDTNLSGAFHICRAACPVMEDGGSIVNVSSLSAAIGTFGQANYSAAKAGLIGFTKTLSRELGKRAIRVNAVAPGLVLTHMGKSVPEHVRAQWLEQIPLRRFGEPSDIGNVILFLCSPLAAYVTGQTIHVNGGWFAS